MILEINSIYLYRNKKQIFDNFNLKLKKKTNFTLGRRKWSWEKQFDGYDCGTNPTQQW